MCAQDFSDLSNIDEPIRHDRDPNFLKSGRAGDAAGSRILDLRQAPQDFLYPISRHLDAAAVDDVGTATSETQDPIGREQTDVARIEPPVPDTRDTVGARSLDIFRQLWRAV